MVLEHAWRMFQRNGEQEDASAHAGRAGHHPTGSFPVHLVLCPTHPCVQQGKEMRMRQCLTSLSFSPFCSLLSLCLPATILASCRRHHSSIQAISARKKKIVLPCAHQMLSVVSLLSPAERGVVAQTMGRKRNIQVFLHLSLPKQGNSSFRQRNARA